GWSPALERAHHHELSVSRRIGDTNIQAAVYTDRIGNTALTGVGDALGELGDVLPDVYAQTFTYNGNRLNTNGVRVVVERKLASGLRGTFDYAYGGVLDIAPNTSWESIQPALHAERRHAVSAKLSGTIPLTKTRWITAYKWTSGTALTPVDLFNASAGQASPYWSVFVRQPIPGSSFTSGHME